MVPCRRDADCERLCGSHAETKLYYVCQRRYQLYDFMKSNTNGEPYWLNQSGPLGAITYAPYDPPKDVFTHEHDPMDGICMVRAAPFLTRQIPPLIPDGHRSRSTLDAIAFVLLTTRVFLYPHTIAGF